MSTGPVMIINSFLIILSQCLNPQTALILIPWIMLFGVPSAAEIGYCVVCLLLYFLFTLVSS